MAIYVANRPYLWNPQSVFHPCPSLAKKETGTGDSPLLRVGLTRW